MLKRRTIMSIRDYLYKKSTKPIMTIRFQAHHIAGRIYGIDTPTVTRYKYTVTVKSWGRSFSRELQPERWEDKEIVETYKKKGWKWDIIHPYNGYEMDCLIKEEPFKELPKGYNLVGVTWDQILEGRDAIEDYMRINFRSFAPITIYKVPESLL